MKLIKTLLLLLLLTLTLASTDTSPKVYNVVIMGKTGVGKSSLINSLFKEQVAAVGHDEATTMDVQKFIKMEGKNTINIWDTMGLYDDLGDPKEYIHRIADTVKKAHLILFCFDSSEARWTKDSKEMIELVKKELTKDIFNNTLFVFTKYNVHRNEKSLETRKHKVLSVVPDAKFGVAESPESKDWDTKLWKEILTVVKENSKPIFIDIMNKRSRVCLISKRIKENVLEKGIFPNVMTNKQREVRDICVKEKVEKYNKKVGLIKNTLATGGAIALYSVAGPVVRVAKIMIGGLSMGLGTVIEGKVSGYERESSYCNDSVKIINMENYNDEYEYPDGKYIGEFKRMLFHGQGTMYDEHNNKLFSGEFIDGMPSICF
jgi:small GTP-binding protein